MTTDTTESGNPQLAASCADAGDRRADIGYRHHRHLRVDAADHYSEQGARTARSRFQGSAWRQPDAGAGVPGRRTRRRREPDKDEPVIYGGYDEAREFVGYAMPAAGPGFQDTIAILYGYKPGKNWSSAWKYSRAGRRPGWVTRSTRMPIRWRFQRVVRRTRNRRREERHQE